MPKISIFSTVGILISVLFVNVAIAQDDVAVAQDDMAVAEITLTLINTNTEEVITLTDDELLAFEQVTIRTENEFVDGMAEFSGPRARDVLALFEAEVEDYTLTAVNDYSVVIPAEDFENYDVIFAMYQDGERFSLRTKGPLWVIYPMSDYDVLQDRVYNDRLIWQLASVTIE